METRIKDIVTEAVQTSTITRITYQEREALGRIYKELTGEEPDILCNACLLKMCNKINSLRYGEKQKKSKSHRGRNGGNLRRN